MGIPLAINHKSGLAIKIINAQVWPVFNGHYLKSYLMVNSWWSNGQLLDPGYWYKFTYWMTNSVDPDQFWRSQLIWIYNVCKGGHVWDQQDQG